VVSLNNPTSTKVFHKNSYCAMSKIFQILLLVSLGLTVIGCQSDNDLNSMDKKVEKLIKRMTLDEKIGQLMQRNGDHPNLSELIRQGRVGSVLNEVNREAVLEIQRIAVEESRFGIPIII
jgi:beta-glucosidase